MILGQEFALSAALSAAAAGMSHVIHHPLYTLKSQMMYYGAEFSLKNFLHRAATERTSFLYRGLVSRTIGIMPEKALKMQGWIMVGRLMERNFEQPTYSKWIVAGAAAGAATTLIGCPSERAMVLAHIQKQGFWHVIRMTGLKGLYFGLRPTLYRDVSFNMIFFTVRELSVRTFAKFKGHDPDPWSRMLLGIPAGSLASVVACPFDVVKTRMQGKELAGQRNVSCSRIMLDIIRKESPWHLMKGLLPRLIAVPSMMSCFYVINEELEKRMMNTKML